jgi:hypothetical protein
MELQLITRECKGVGELKCHFESAFFLPGLRDSTQISVLEV